MPDRVRLVVGLLWVAFFSYLAWRLFRRRGTPGPGAIGAVYDLLIQDRREAVELIVEEQAEATDPETVDGNLPDLETPGKGPD
jgi:hypothetical protein